MLQKTLVREYYRQNVAFYLFIILFCFGFMSGNEHRQLITVIMGRPTLLFFVGIVWFFHVLKSSLFVHQTLQEPEYAFLRENSILPGKEKWFSLLGLQLSLNLPFFLYAIAMNAVGLMLQNFLSVTIVILLNVTFLAIPVIWLNNRFLESNENRSLARKLNLKIIPNHRVYYFLRHLLNEKWLLYVSMKLYSVSFIVGAARLFPTDEYDFRLLGLGVFLGSVGLFPLGVEKIMFENQKLSFERNFPVTPLKKFFNLILESFFLLLPEMLLMVYHWFGKVSLIHLGGALAYLLAGLTFWYCIQYSSFALQKNFGNRIFFVLVFIFVLIMFKVHLLLLAMIILILSWLILQRNYFNFELSQSDDK